MNNAICRTCGQPIHFSYEAGDWYHDTTAAILACPSTVVAPTRSTGSQLTAQEVSDALIVNIADIFDQRSDLPGIIVITGNGQRFGIEVTDLTHYASCGHPANEDGECNCSSWPERATLAV